MGYKNSIQQKLLITVFPSVHAQVYKSKEETARVLWGIKHLIWKGVLWGVSALVCMTYIISIFCNMNDVESIIIIELIDVLPF